MECFGIEDIFIAVTLKLQFTEEMREGGVNVDLPQNRYNVLRSPVLRIDVFWDLTLCCLMSGSWHSKESYCLHPSGSSRPKNFYMNGTTVFETMGTTHQVAQRHISEDSNPQQHGCENLKSCKTGFVKSQAQLSSTIPISVFKLISKLIKKCSECYRVKN